jgi:hypothetical protein
MQTVERTDAPQECDMSDRQCPNESDSIIGECPVCRLFIFGDDATAYDVWDRVIHDECRAAFLRQVSGAKT